MGAGAEEAEWAFIEAAEFGCRAGTGGVGLTSSTALT
jgi:hypothetical protein